MALDKKTNVDFPAESSGLLVEQSLVKKYGLSKNGFWASDCRNTFATNNSYL